jgi:hypothetical protein
MSKRYYNPHRVTQTERLAFNLSGDKKVKATIIRRKRNNSALNVNQQKLIAFQYGKKTVSQERKTTVQYQGDDRNFVISTE